LTISLAGALAGALPAYLVIAVSGGLGTVIATVLALSWQRRPANSTNSVLVD
jgi:hypothetical protein